LELLDYILIEVQRHGLSRSIEGRPSGSDKPIPMADFRLVENSLVSSGAVSGSSAICRAISLSVVASSFAKSL